MGERQVPHQVVCCGWGAEYRTREQRSLVFGLPLLRFALARLVTPAATDN